MISENYRQNVEDILELQTMNSDLENILNKANKLSKQEKQISVESNIFEPNDRYDYLVFTKLVSYSGFNVFIFLILIPIFLMTGFLLQDYNRQVVILLFAYITCLMIYNVINFFRYRFQFIGWVERLIFTLKGFDELIRSKKMFCDLCWNDIQIKITLKENSTEIEKFIEAALILFCKETEKAFYTKSSDKTTRKNRESWKVSSYTSCTGSANPEVLRYLKNLLEKDLTTIQSRTNSIQEVQVLIVSEEFEIPIQMNVGNN